VTAPAVNVIFDEDRARNRKDNGPENLAILRKLALNVLAILRDAALRAAPQDEDRMWSIATRPSLMVRSGPQDRVSNQGRKFTRRNPL
jgi:hypothetical protein